jgi:ligand-binding SRPBCC domain-containing protein
MNRLEREVVLNVDPQTLWSFIATPLNLNLLTPPDLQFAILSDVPEKMYDGLLLRYEITLPLIGKQHWLTEIREIVDGVSFVDEQRAGPYKSWHHRHVISAEDDGRSRMRDEVRYRLPFGVAGVVAHQVWVKSQLERIFNYREQKLGELFP